MAEIQCGLDTITKPQNCNDRGGIRALYWVERSQVDFDAMLADATKFDPANQQILGYTMQAGAVFNKVEFERKEAFYSFGYTDELDAYNLLITLGFKGKSLARRNSLQKAIGCCDVYVHIYGNDGTQRTVGSDYNGEVFDPIVDALHITRHDDAGGQLGTSRSTDSLDLGGEAFFAPMFANVPESAIPLA